MCVPVPPALCFKCVRLRRRRLRDLRLYGWKEIRVVVVCVPTATGRMVDGAMEREGASRRWNVDLCGWVFVSVVPGVLALCFGRLGQLGEVARFLQVLINAKLPSAAKLFLFSNRLDMIPGIILFLSHSCYGT